MNDEQINKLITEQYRPVAEWMRKLPEDEGYVSIIDLEAFLIRQAEQVAHQVDYTNTDTAVMGYLTGLSEVMYITQAIRQLNEESELEKMVEND